MQPETLWASYTGGGKKASVYVPVNDDKIDITPLHPSEGLRARFM